MVSMIGGGAPYTFADALKAVGLRIERTGYITAKLFDGDEMVFEGSGSDCMQWIRTSKYAGRLQKAVEENTRPQVTTGPKNIVDALREQGVNTEEELSEIEGLLRDLEEGN